MKHTHTIRKISLLFLLIPLIVNVHGQEGNSNITKDEIINNVWKTMFGEHRNEDIKSIYVEGFFHGEDVPNRMIIKRPNLFRNEVHSGVLVFNGKCAAWVKREPDEKGKHRSPEMIDTASWKHFEVDIALLFPAFFEYPSELKGLKDYEGTEVYELYVELPLGGNITYFVDIESFLIIRRLVSWDGNPAGDLWENLIIEYIDYKGILFPDGYTYNGREGIEKGLYKNVKINIMPEDSLFEIPIGLK